MKVYGSDICIDCKIFKFAISNSFFNQVCICFNNSIHSFKSTNHVAFCYKVKFAIFCRFCVCFCWLSC